MIDAEARGIFRQPAVDDYYLQKAARDPDRRAEWCDEPLPVQTAPVQPVAPPVPVQAAASSERPMKDLRAEMKAQGLNSFGKGRADIEMELADARGERQTES